MPFDEDLSVFFNSAELASTATYNGATPVDVIFDRAYIEALVNMAGTAPVALALASDIPPGAEGKTLAISGTTYTIRGREPQDDGAVVLLRLEAP